MGVACLLVALVIAVVMGSRDDLVAMKLANLQQEQAIWQHSPPGTRYVEVCPPVAPATPPRWTRDDCTLKAVPLQTVAQESVNATLYNATALYVFSVFISLGCLAMGAGDIRPAWLLRGGCAVVVCIVRSISALVAWLARRGRPD